MNTLEQSANCIIQLAHDIVGVEIDKQVLLGVLQADWEVVGRFPSDEECTLLCNPGDLAGPPLSGDEHQKLDVLLDELEMNFPQTFEFVSSSFEDA